MANQNLACLIICEKIKTSRWINNSSITNILIIKQIKFMKEQVKKFIESLPESTSDETHAEASAKMIKQTYAKYSSLTRKNGKLYGCFNPDFSEACEETKVTSIQLTAIEFSQYANDCSDGSGVYIITYN